MLDCQSTHIGVKAGSFLAVKPEGLSTEGINRQNKQTESTVKVTRAEALPSR